MYFHTYYKPLSKSSTTFTGLHEKEQKSLQLTKCFHERISFYPDFNPHPCKDPTFPACLVDPLGELAFSLRHLPLTYVPDTSGLSRTQICHHQFFYLQRLLCKAWEVIPLLPSLILVGDCCLLGDKYSDFETCYLVENLNVSAIYLCFVSWWIHEDRDGRGKSLRSAISPLNVMKLQK